MRKIIYCAATTFDGFIASEDGTVDWIQMDDDARKEVVEVLSKFFESIDTLLMGRKTYEEAIKSPHDHYPSGKKRYVFSRTLKTSSHPEVEIISENAAEFIRGLKNQHGKDIWFAGGGNLAQTLFNEDLVDEIRLGVHPVLLGSGIRLFPKINQQVDLELMESKAHKGGGLSVSYRVKHP